MSRDTVTANTMSAKVSMLGCHRSSTASVMKLAAVRSASFHPARSPAITVRVTRTPSQVIRSITLTNPSNTAFTPCRMGSRKFAKSGLVGLSITQSWNARKGRAASTTQDCGKPPEKSTSPRTTATTTATAMNTRRGHRDGTGATIVRG